MKQSSSASSSARRDRSAAVQHVLPGVGIWGPYHILYGEICSHITGTAPTVIDICIFFIFEWEFGYIWVVRVDRAMDTEVPKSNPSTSGATAKDQA